VLFRRLSVTKKKSFERFDISRKKFLTQKLKKINKFENISPSSYIDELTESSFFFFLLDAFVFAKNTPPVVLILFFQ
jgi:hypothetical protein